MPIHLANVERRYAADKRTDILELNGFLKDFAGRQQRHVVVCNEISFSGDSRTGDTRDQGVAHAKSMMYGLFADQTQLAACWFKR